MNSHESNFKFQISDFKWRAGTIVRAAAAVWAAVIVVAMAGNAGQISHRGAETQRKQVSGIRSQVSGKGSADTATVLRACASHSKVTFWDGGRQLRREILGFAQDDKRDGELKVAPTNSIGVRGEWRNAPAAAQYEGAGPSFLGTSKMPAVQEPQAPAIKREVRLALVEATVKDKGGKAMKVLKKDDFLLYEDGKPQEIAHFSQDQLPLAVAMVVDLSGSIQPFLRPLRYASISALKALKQEDEVVLFTFTEHVDKRVDLTKDKLAVSDQIEFFEAGGSTNINDALYEAARYLRREAPAARRVIVLVSDNVPTAGGESPQDVLTEALEADAAIYSLKVPGDNPRGMGVIRVGRGLVNVKNITEETGGEIFDVEKEGSLYLAFSALIERLKTRYTLGFYPAGPSANSRQLKKLEVKLGPSFGVKGRDYTVVSKRGYYPSALGTN